MAGTSGKPREGSVRVSARDERTIIVHFPASAAEIANALMGLDGGYMLVDIDLIQGGHQRDPITEGVRLVFARGSRDGA